MSQTSYFLHAALSYQGESHRRSGIVNQDAWHCRSRGGLIVGAVCDGAGSQIWSHLGSRFLSLLACRWLESKFDELHSCDDIAIRRDFFNFARPRFQVYARLCGHSQEELACTLILAALHQDGRWLALHLGDGVLLAQTSRQTIPVSLPDNGENATVTWFFTSPDAPPRTRVYQGRGYLQGDRICGLLLASDGIEKALVHLHTGKAALISSVLVRRLAQVGREELERQLQASEGLFRERYYSRRD